MTLRELLKFTESNPAILDYTICLTEFFLGEKDNDDMSVVSDCPVSGIAFNDEEEELKFIISRSNYHAFEVSEDNILKLIRKEK